MPQFLAGQAPRSIVESTNKRQRTELVWWQGSTVKRPPSVNRPFCSGCDTRDGAMGSAISAVAIRGRRPLIGAQANGTPAQRGQVQAQPGLRRGHRLPGPARTRQGDHPPAHHLPLGPRAPQRRHHRRHRHRQDLRCWGMPPSGSNGTSLQSVDRCAGRTARPPTPSGRRGRSPPRTPGRRWASRSAARRRREPSPSPHASGSATASPAAAAAGAGCSPARRPGPCAGNAARGCSWRREPPSCGTRSVADEKESRAATTTGPNIPAILVWLITRTVLIESPET